MTPDTHAWSDTTRTTRGTRPPRRSMIGGGSGSAEPTDEISGPTAAERAQELRASLGVQRDVGTMIAEASEMRARAASDADGLIATAEEVAAKLIAETRREAERLLDEAKVEAESVAARAEEERARMRAEVEAEVRAEVRAELEHERARVGEVLTRTADRLRSLRPELEDSLLVVGGALDALPEARSEGPRAGGILVPVGDIGPDPSGPDASDDETGERTPEDDSSPTLASVGVEARPLGWLFRSQQG
jgi:hypothetical protein